jgi:hypothetical protein
LSLFANRNAKVVFIYHSGNIIANLLAKDTDKTIECKRVKQNYMLEAKKISKNVMIFWLKLSKNSIGKLNQKIVNHKLKHPNKFEYIDI